MFLEIILAIALGTLAGIFTGLTPGIHVNLITVIAISLAPFDPLSTSLFIISLAITHSFLDAIPGIYLGAPDADQALNVLPGHRYLMKGGGHFALKMTIIGSLGATALALLLSPLLIAAMDFIYPLINKYTGYLLIVIMIFMIARNKWFISLFVFLFAGAYGLVVLNLGMNQPLLPLLSGLFGFSVLLTSQSEIPRQTGYEENIKMANLIKATCAATLVGFVAAFLPGFGSAQAAILALTFVGDLKDYGFLILVGGINSANMLISLCTAFALEKARNGAVVGILELIPDVSIDILLLFLTVSLLAAASASVIALSVSKFFARYISRINYTLLRAFIMLMIITITVYFDLWKGVIVLIGASALGVFTHFMGVGKNHLMGCLIVPTILYFM